MTILVTKPIHPPALHLYSHHYHFYNIWMFNHPRATKYHPFCDFLMLGDKIFNRIIREELFKFSIQLRRQSLIMCNDQRRFVQLLNNICHGKRLTGAGNSQQSLTLISFPKTRRQFCNRLGLVAGRLIFRY